MSLIRIAIMIVLLISIRNCDPGMPPFVDSLLAGPTATSRDDSVSEEKSAPSTSTPPAVEKELVQNGTALEPAVRESITTSQRTIEADEKRLDALKQEVADPDGEYNQAQKAFKDTDSQLTEKKQQLEELEKEKGETEAAPLRAEVKTLDTSWTLAKDRLQLATKERQTLQAKTVALEQKIQQDRKALLRLIGGDRPASPPATPSDAGSPNEVKEGQATPAKALIK
jgi:chromosome segregation ATPase